MYWMTNDGPTNWTRCGYLSEKKREKNLKKTGFARCGCTAKKGCAYHRFSAPINQAERDERYKILTGDPNGLPEYTSEPRPTFP